MPSDLGPARLPLSLLGVRLDSVTLEEALKQIPVMLETKRPHYVVTVNADFLAQAARDLELRRILVEADLALCDGTPLVWASRLLGNRLPERVAGSDLVPQLLEMASERGFTVFLLGAAPERLDAAVRNLRRTMPSLSIAGSYSPPYATLLEMDHEAITRKVREARPDLLLVCFGCPKQEKWIAMHCAELGVPVSLGVGGTIDFLSGHLKRAPLWMQRGGLEWLFRLAQEPRRLFKRYLTDLWCFGLGVARQWASTSGNRPNLEISRPEPNGPVVCVSFAGALTQHGLGANHAAALLLRPPQLSHVFDLGGVTAIDSTGIGFLLRLRQNARAAGCHCVLAALSTRARRVLSRMKVLELFECADTADSARALVLRRISEQSFRVLLDPEKGCVQWEGEITAANATSIWQNTSALLPLLPGGEWKLELSRVTFLDSTGLGLMIRAKKLAASSGGRLTLRNCSRPVMNVIRISGLNAHFFGPRQALTLPREAPQRSIRSA